MAHLRVDEAERLAAAGEVTQAMALLAKAAAGGDADAAMLLAVWYDLSDVKLSDALEDRASFCRFFGFSGIEATLVRDGDRVIATIAPRGTSSPQALAAVWALTEHGHATAVRAGENRGATLGNDAVVRRWETVAAWKADARGSRQLAFQAPAAPAASRQSVVLVVLDASTGRPVDAVSLGC